MRLISLRVPSDIFYELGATFSSLNPENPLILKNPDIFLPNFVHSTPHIQCLETEVFAPY